ncbi:phage tail protein [Vibrio sp. Vb2853]|uniref:phage tail-collar fiber domain-containing protein n=1 Tax=unclassified Vibrio TaxID=2614977 RepID=UPI002964E07D|nr:MULTISPECIES: phage tail protein [unclassified Vibrio]MDW1615048.1 phage tail protein [Vibrio sp. Vb2881]MDW1619764.1 phage tail protein [Vibrio sp. Vb2864]MDW1691898.1 phage tail protein [Vibrio sp. Vb2853]MDW1710608.1 phage tail protein [Vibrio sp. Vb2865]MDW1715729.1 phage tail protein [Vibrio sp. Vb2873]
MAQSIITAAFEAYKAQQEALEQPVALDEFVLAMVPDQEHNEPIDANESLPAETQIVHVADVTQTGYVNPNAVAYSITLDTRVGDFEFNWIGLRNKASGTLAAISHIPTIQKIQSIAGVQNGNAVTRSILMSYQDAKNLTGITVDASSWQIDFTARLFGIDENERLVNLDVFGHGAFLGDGFKVTKSGQTYSVMQGRGYVGGLRCHLNVDTPLTGVVGGVSIYLDASWQGHVTSQWSTVFAFKVSDDALTDYVGADGYQHYVTKLAEVDAAGNITDCRYLEGFAQYYQQSVLDEMLGKKVDQSDFESHKHNASDITAGTLAKERLPDATTGAKGAVTLTDSTSSSSSVLAATAKAVKAAYDEAKSKWSYVVASTSVYGATKLSSAINSSSQALAATPKAVKEAYDLAASKLTQSTADGRYLKKTAKAVDSDKLDGKHANEFASSQGRVVNDYNMFKSPGMYGVNGTGENAPANNGFGCLIVSANIDTGLQIAGGHNNGHLAFRGWSASGDSWEPWRTIYHSGFKPTKSDVGLSNVNNWGATSATNSSSATTYATAAGVKSAYDLASICFRSRGDLSDDYKNWANVPLSGTYCVSYGSSKSTVAMFKRIGTSTGTIGIELLYSGQMYAYSNTDSKRWAKYTIYTSANKPTAEDVGAMTKWKLLKSGTCSIAAKNSAVGVYQETIDTGVVVTSRQFDPQRYKVVLSNSGNTITASNPSTCWWSAWAQVLPKTVWSGTSTVTFAVYCAGGGISSGTGVGQWYLYEAV